MATKKCDQCGGIYHSEWGECLRCRGRKDDQGKLRWTLLPWVSVSQIVRVLEFGAEKYAPGNWKKVSNPVDRYADALLRHVIAWTNGEKLDPESGHHHLAHAGCCVLFLLWFDHQPATAALREEVPEWTDETKECDQCGNPFFWSPGAPLRCRPCYPDGYNAEDRERAQVVEFSYD